MRAVSAVCACAAVAAAVCVRAATAAAVPALTEPVTRGPRVESIAKPLEKIAFGSCNDQSFPQPLWPAIARHAPDLWVWMGDNIYADMPELGQPRKLWPPGKMFTEATEAELRRRYTRQLNNENYSAFANSTPMIAIWDDHDFGINDGHKGYTHRADSQRVFLDYFNEPADSPRRQQEGIYASYTVGTGDKAVKFILIDNRYHRDDYKTQNGDFLGLAQWAWLERELTGSTAAFNVIVSGIQILPADRFFPAESWSRFPPQRERLLALILKSKARGVILLSGDVHFAEVNQVVCSNGQNVITEMTSSGLTHSWMQFHAPSIRFFPALLFTFANMILPWEFRPRAQDFYAYLNWGMIDVDWNARLHPVARVRVRGQDDRVKLAFDVPSTPVFSRTPEQDAVTCQPPRDVDPRVRGLYRALLLAVLALTAASLAFNGVVLLWLAWFALTKLLRRAPREKKEKEKKKTN